jgi:hypothetical protein
MTVKLDYYVPIARIYPKEMTSDEVWAEIQAETVAEVKAEAEAGFTDLESAFAELANKSWYPAAKAELEAIIDGPAGRVERKPDPEAQELMQALLRAQKQFDKAKAERQGAIFAGDAKAKAALGVYQSAYEDANARFFSYTNAKEKEKPEPEPFSDITFPASICWQPRWGVFVLVWDEAKKKYNKIPYNVRTQRPGEFFSDETGVFLSDAMKFWKSDPKKFAGVGYGFNEKESGGVVGIDIDNCIDPQTHEIAPWAKEIRDSLDSYTEQSISGKGLHILVKAAMPKGLNGETRQGIHIDPIEVYSGKRFFALTGWKLTEHEVERRQVALNAFVARVERREFDIYNKAAKAAEIQTATPAEIQTAVTTPTQPAPVSSDGSMYPISNPNGIVSTNRITLLTKGQIVNENKAASIFQVQDELGNEVTYPSHSDADGSLCVALAIHHIGQGMTDDVDLAKAIRQDFEQSALFRDEKGGSKRPEYLDKYTIPSAIKKAKAIATHFEQTPPPAARKVNTEGVYTAEMAEEEARRLEEKLTESILIDEPIPQTEDEAQLEMATKQRVVMRQPKDGAPYFDAGSVLYGIAGDIIRKIDAESESHPAGNLLEFLVGFGNLIGRGPYFMHESTTHYTNEYGIRVGESALSRKGTGRDRVQELLGKLDRKWMRDCVRGGFGSGEAVIQAITDEIKQFQLDKKGNRKEVIVTQDVPDKRLLVSEGEFSGVMKKAAMDGSLFSEVFRNAYDCKKLENTVKGSPCKCMEPFLSCSCDTNLEDLRDLLKDKPNAGNGFGNRFMYAFVDRTKDIARGGKRLDWSKELGEHRDESQDSLLPERHSLFDLVTYAKGRKEVTRSWTAESVWERMYKSFETRVRGMHKSAAALVTRGEAHIARLSLIYALLDKSEHIEPEHIYAAKALWDYCVDSVEWVFSGRTADLYLIMSRLDTRDADKEEQSAAQIQNAIFRPGHSQHPRPVSYVEGCLNYLWVHGYIRRLEGEKGVYSWTRKNSPKVWKVGGVTT